MNAPFNMHFGQCGCCGRPLRRSLPCPLCGRSCCRWKCYSQHLDLHREAGGRGAGRACQTAGARARRFAGGGRAGGLLD